MVFILEWLCWRTIILTSRRTVDFEKTLSFSFWKFLFAHINLVLYSSPTFFMICEKFMSAHRLLPFGKKKSSLHLFPLISPPVCWVQEGLWTSYWASWQWVFKRVVRHRSELGISTNTPRPLAHFGVFLPLADRCTTLNQQARQNELVSEELLQVCTGWLQRAKVNTAPNTACRI